MLLWASQDLLSCFENKLPGRLFRLKADKGFLAGNLQKILKNISLHKDTTDLHDTVFICITDAYSIHSFTLVHSLISHVLDTYVLCSLLHTRIKW